MQSLVIILQGGIRLDNLIGKWVRRKCDDDFYGFELNKWYQIVEVDKLCTCKYRIYNGEIYQGGYSVMDECFDWYNIKDYNPDTHILVKVGDTVGYEYRDKARLHVIAVNQKWKESQDAVLIFSNGTYASGFNMITSINGEDVGERIIFTQNSEKISNTSDNSLVIDNVLINKSNKPITKTELVHTLEYNGWKHNAGSIYYYSGDDIIQISNTSDHYSATFGSESITTAKLETFMDFVMDNADLHSIPDQYEYIREVQSGWWVKANNSTIFSDITAGTYYEVLELEVSSTTCDSVKVISDVSNEYYVALHHFDWSTAVPYPNQVASYSSVWSDLKASQNQLERLIKHKVEACWRNENNYTTPIELAKTINKAIACLLGVSDNKLAQQDDSCGCSL